MDLPGELRIRFEDIGDGTGELWVQARANGFSGEGGAWFTTKELQDFADALTAYPLAEGESPEIVSCSYKKDGSGHLVPDQEFLALKVYPINSVGHLGIQVRIASGLLMYQRPESQHTVRLEIISSYGPVAQFSRDLKALITRKAVEAVIHGETDFVS